jgi:hypothetical protein
MSKRKKISPTTDRVPLEVNAGTTVVEAAEHKGSQLIAGLRNLAALAVTLGGAAFIMLAPWRGWVKPSLLWMGWDYDEWFALLFAASVGFVASVIGKYNGAVWYIPWLIGIGSSDQFTNPQGDPEFCLGMAIWARLSFPMVPVGFLTSVMKKRFRARRGIEHPDN